MEKWIADPKAVLKNKSEKHKIIKDTFDNIKDNTIELDECYMYLNHWLKVFYEIDQIQ